MAATPTTIAKATARVWHLVDAKNQVVGRLAPQIAHLLAGKHKPTYLPHVDAGDFVVVVNTRHVVLTGNKMRDKLYRWHTGWMGGLKTLTARQLHERAPERVLQHAVKGMLPPNSTRKERMRRLRLFADEEHIHGIQVEASQQYAPAFMRQYRPLDNFPRPKAVSGMLVKDFFVEGEASDATAARLALFEKEAAGTMAEENAMLEEMLKVEEEAARQKAPPA